MTFETNLLPIIDKNKMPEIIDYQNLYYNNLFANVIPFWMNHSKDSEYGGYFTCLDRDGSVYDTDKFIWLQARQVWTFSMLYNQVDQKKEWLDFASHGADFLIKHGQSKDGSWFFSTNREGKPLIAPYNIFSDCFASQAMAQLAKATGESKYRTLAESTFQNILTRRDNPKGKWSKAIQGTRPLKNFALPMILSNLAIELDEILDESIKTELISQCVHEVMEVFYHQESGLILENVTPDGHFSDSFEGRLLNPGHAIEAMWFIMDIGVKNQDKDLINKAKDITLHTLDYAWDKEFGGIYYFMDLLKKPVQQLEWDQKLWWVHIETLIALLKGYLHTKDERCWQWFKKVHDYTWSKFIDEKYGEWYGYLKRDGNKLLPLKGGKWKGCYHVPRGLYQCCKTLEQLESSNK
jgi:N-acylglucosamine 2-epimerase